MIVGEIRKKVNKKWLDNGELREETFRRNTTCSSCWGVVAEVIVVVVVVVEVVAGTAILVVSVEAWENRSECRFLFIVG